MPPADEHRDPWWTLDEGAAARAMVDLVDHIRDRSSTRRQRLALWDDIYTGAPTMGYGDALDYLDAHAGLGRGRLNFTRSAVDFLHARVTAQTPDVVARGVDADWSRSLQARRLTKFIEGAMDQLDATVALPRACLMALRHGDGAVKLSATDDGRVEMENIDIGELHVDPADARHGRPRCLYQVRPVSRSGLVAEMEARGDDDLADAVRRAPAARTDTGRMWTPDDTSLDPDDSVDLYEAWRLPSGREAGDGRHIVTLAGDGGTLTDEPWDKPRFPVAVMSCYPPRPGAGMWSQGVVELLDPEQYKIDELVGQIDEHIRFARMKAWVPEGSVDLDHLADPSVGNMVEYDPARGPPTFQTPEPVSREVIQHLQWLVEQLYARAGMTQDAASSQKPAGLNSGRAQLVHFDMQSMRHIDLSKRYQAFVVDVVERLLDVASLLDAEGEASWSVPTRRSDASMVRWSEVGEDRDSFQVRLRPVSPIPTTEAGQQQQVEDIIARGDAPASYTEALFADPDLWKVRRRATADADFIDHLVERLLYPETGPVPPVLDAMDLEGCVDILRAELLDAVREGADPETVARLDGYIQEVADRIADRQAALAPALPPPVGDQGPGGAPGGPGSAPPPAPLA